MNAGQLDILLEAALATTRNVDGRPVCTIDVRGLMDLAASLRSAWGKIGTERARARYASSAERDAQSREEEHRDELLLGVEDAAREAAYRIDCFMREAGAPEKAGVDPAKDLLCDVYFALQEARHEYAHALAAVEGEECCFSKCGRTSGVEVEAVPSCDGGSPS